MTAAATSLRESAPGFDTLGITAFTTTRQAGSFLLTAPGTAKEAAARWLALGAELARDGRMRLAYAHQVHGTGVIEHGDGWAGWLRGASGDGHFSTVRGTAMAVTLADCVPVFIGHPNGSAAVLHSGWKGTAAGITSRGIRQFVALGMRAGDLILHAGPAICGRCYEVGPDVFARLTGRSVDRPTPVDLREIIVAQAREAGVRNVSVSEWCTRCDNEHFFSHRAGDSGRQVGVVVG